MIERAKVLLSVQRALLGAVPQSLRGVTCGWQDDLVTLHFIFDGPADANDEENMHIVASEVIADFNAPASIDEHIISVERYESLKHHALQAWAYIRKENSVDQAAKRLESTP